MDLYDTNSVSWMLAGGLRDDPEELRNRAHRRALRESDPRPSLTDRIRAFVTGSAPVTATPADRVCCLA